MAKKLSLDFSKKTPAWAAQLRRDFTDRQNAEARVDAAIGEIVGQDGVAITEEQRNKAVDDFLRTGNFDLQAQPTEEVFPQQKAGPAVAPVLPSTVKKPLIELPDAVVKTYDLIEDTYKKIPVLGDVRSSLLAGASDIITDTMFQEMDAQQMKEAGAVVPSLSERALGPAAKLTPLGPIADVVGEVTAPAREAIAGTDTYKTIFGNLSKYVDDTRKEVAENNRKSIEGSLLGYGRQAITDIAGSPQSLASLPGGPFAAIPAATTYADAYREAREAKVPVPEAQKYAAEQAGIEGGISAIPAAKVGKVLLKPLAKTPAAKGLAEVIEGRFGRIAKAGVGESVEEMVQTGAADAVNRLEATFAESDVTREFARGQISEDLPADLRRAGLAGLFGGAGFTAPSAHVEFAAEQGRQQAETTAAALTGARGAMAKPKAAVEAEQEQELRGRVADEALFKEEAFEAKEAEEATRKELEEEAGFRTIEQRATERKLGKLGKVKPAPEVTPEQVVQEREAADKAVDKELAAIGKAEKERAERVELGGLTEDIRKQREAAKKAEEKATKEKAKKDKAAETKRRMDLARQVALESPHLSPDELAPILRERLAQKPAVEEAPAKPARKTKEAPQKPDKQMGDSEVADLSARLGLGMQESVKQDENAPAFDRPAFEQKVGEVVRTLVKKNKQNTADVQNLIRQGKLVLVPNAESAGREATDDVAQYVPEEGRMYLYTDKVDSKNAPAIMARALHEATHAGQFNDRAGRPSVIKQMMTGSAENKASKAIAKAAESGNKLAQEAVRQAQAASPNESIQDLELVPYFVTEAAKARGTTLGSLRGVANDVMSSARNFVREKLGVDLDFTMSDLEAAAQKTAGEIVKTDVKPSEGESLGMIAGPSAKSFVEAKATGKTYKGRVDRGERFEIPDNEAELNIGDGQKVLNQKQVGLSEVLDHSKLYEEYPWLANYKINFIPLAGAYGEHSRSLHQISINEILLKNALFAKDLKVRADNAERIRTTLLHEAQHAIQDREGFLSGANPKNFISAEATRNLENARRRYNDAVKNFDFGRALQTLSPDTKRIWDNEVRAAGVTTRDAQATLFLQEGYAQDSNDRLIKRVGLNFENIQKERDAAEEAYAQVERKAFQTYLREYGETEARTTEKRSRMTAEELAAKTPEETFKEAEGAVPVEETLDTTPFMGGRRELPQSVGMAEEAETDVPAKRRVPAVITGLFRSDIGLGRDINEIVEYARSSPAGARLQAEAHLERYGKALNQLAKERGVTPQTMAKEIEDKLDAIDKKSDSYEQNRENFIQVASQYGAAGRNLIALRDMIDELSLNILRQRAAEGTPLSEKEKATYKTLLSNLGRYAHRTYAANIGKMGDSYAKDVWKSWEKANKGKKLSESDKANAAKVTKAISYLVDNELNIPEDEELSNISTDKARALYSTWIGPRNVDAIPVEQVKEELAAVRDDVNGDKKRLANQAEATARELLGLTDTTGPLVKYYRGAKQDTGILKERENIPKELRDLMGEIVDPAAKLMITVGKQAEFVARNRMMLELRQHVGTDLQPPDAAGTDAAKGMTQLEGEQYGPLEGYYVSKNMRAFIGDTMQQLATFEQVVAMANHKPQELPKRVLSAAFDKWATIASVSKAASVIGNPVRFIYNYIGSYRQLVSNGNINPKYWVEGHKAMNDVLANALNPSIVTERLKDANTYGVTDSAFIGEIKSEEYRKIANVIKQMSGKSPSAAMAFMKKAKVGYKELYAMMDVWSKLANFYHQVDVLTAFHEANGDKMSDEQIKREAADKVNRTNITYKRAAPLIKGMERGGVTQFGTYFAEVFRSEIGNALEGVAEYRQALNAKNDKARNIMLFQSAKRIGGQTASWAMAAYATRALAQMAFGDDEEKEEKLRALLPEYLRNQDFVVVGKDKDGKDVLFNISQLDPIGPATDIMRNMLNGEASPEQLWKSIRDLYIAPRVGWQLITAAGTMVSDDIRPPKRPTITQEVAPGVYSGMLNASPLEDRQDKAWLNVVESFAPGWVKAARSDNAHPEGATDALTYMGATLYKLEPQKQAKYAAMDYSGVLKNSRKDVAEYFTNHPTYSKEQLIKFLLDEREEEREAYAQARKVYEGMVASGMPARKAAATFKAERLSEAAIKSIRRGAFDSQVVSKDSVTQFMKQEIANAKTLADKKAVKKKWNEAWKILKAADRDIDKGEQ